MYLTRLIYYSDATPGADLNIESLLKTARDFNARNNVTGALWYDGDHFVQVLEGGRRAVSQTYHRIAVDQRHREIELVSCCGIDSRLFHQWSMGLFADTQDNRSLLLKYSGENKLDPRRLSANSLLHILVEGELRNN